MQSTFAFSLGMRIFHTLSSFPCQAALLSKATPRVLGTVSDASDISSKAALEWGCKEMALPRYSGSAACQDWVIDCVPAWVDKGAATPKIG